MGLTQKEQNKKYSEYRFKTKVCFICKKRQSKFNFSLSGKKSLKGKKLHSWCKSCMRKYDIKRYKKNKRTINRRNRKFRLNQQKAVYEYLLEHPCVDCGETDIVVLHFDHGKNHKITDVSKMINAYSIKKILTEIKKCEVRCCNCHTRKTAKKFKWYKRIFRKAAVA